MITKANLKVTLSNYSRILEIQTQELLWTVKLVHPSDFISDE